MKRRLAFALALLASPAAAQTVPNLPDLPAWEQALIARTGANPSITSLTGLQNVKMSPGAYMPVYQNPPTNQTFIAPGFNISTCDIVGCPKDGGGNAYDSTRASLYSAETTLFGPSKAEYHVQIDTTVNTGYAPIYQNSTAYTAGEYVTQPSLGLLYQVAANCTSAASGSGPSVTSGSQTDGTCSFAYVANSIVDNKVGFANSVVVGANGGPSWGMANDVVVNQTPSPGMFVAGAEFDITMNGPCLIGLCNAYDLYLSGLTNGELTAFAAISANAGAGKWAAYYGWWCAGSANEIQLACFNDSSTAADAFIDYGTHSDATINTINATVTDVVRMKQGQAISFANGDANLFYAGSNLLEYVQQGQLVFVLDSTTATTSNYAQLLNAGAGFGPYLQAQGGDTNIPLNLAGKGASPVAVYGGGLYVGAGNLSVGASSQEQDANAANWVAPSNCGSLSGATKCRRVYDPNGNAMYSPEWGTY